MWTRKIKELTKNDAEIAGGKGASLGELTRFGIPIPHGFVILSTAFKQFIEEVDIKTDIDAALHTVNVEEMRTVERASEKIKNFIFRAKMPQDIKAEIEKEFKQLNAKLVAVRSSATAEDNAAASWAGQLESYLNVTEKDLLEKVQRCWASLFSARAIFYRFEKNLHAHKISVAVVVQKMVQSEVSGIAFSAHPVSQNRNHVVIEAGFGLGNPIMQGQITPDSYVVEKKSWLLLDKRVCIQKKAIVKRKEGNSNIWIELPEAKGRRQKFSDKEILDIAKLTVKIEQHYGFQVDVEFAMAKGNLYVLQCRPITTLEVTEADVKAGKVMN